MPSYFDPAFLNARITDPVTGVGANVCEHGHLEVHQPASVSTLNSTTTPLGAGAVFTGTAEDVVNYSVISISVYASHVSATDGLSVQFSSDGTNWDFSDEYTIPATTGKTFTLQPVAKWMRVVYTNGGTLQTTFRLTATLHHAYIKPSSHRILDDISPQDDAELTKSVLVGENDNGLYRNINADLGQSLRVTSMPYLYSVAEGNILNHSTLLKYGTRTSVAAATPSTIWEGNTATYVYLSSPEQLKVSSASANDTIAGTGAQKMRFHGLDASYNEITEDVSMAGLGVVTTTNSFTRIFRGYVIQAGSSEVNEGKITVTNNAGTVEQLVVSALEGQTLMTIWTVPAGKTAYLVQGTASSNTNKGARIDMYFRDITNGIFLIKYRSYILTGENAYRFNIPFAIPEKTDIEVRVTTPGSAGVTSCGATFELWYEDA